MKLELEKAFEEKLGAKLRAKPGKPFVDVFDTGLVLRWYSSGRMVAGVRYTANGKQRFKVIRDVVKGVKWVTAARKDAGDIRAKARLGIDQVAVDRATRAAIADRGMTIVKLLPAFLAANEANWRKSYRDTVELHLTDHLRVLTSKPVKGVTQDDVADALKEVATKRGKVAAARARASLSTFYAWATHPDQRHAGSSPVVRVRKKGGDGNGSRDRTLTPSELTEVWHALKDVNEDYARIVRLLILTGQRRNEIGMLPWIEVNRAEKRLELPGGMGSEGRTKNHRAHLVPLSPLALAQLPSEPDRRDPLARTMVFGRRGHSGYSGWGKAKAELDAAIAKARRKRGVKDDMAPWIIHDLRRTAVTLMAEKKIAPPHVIEAIVNHISGHKAGIAGTYNRATYLEERIKALDDWSAYVERLGAAQTA